MLYIIYTRGRLPGAKKRIASGGDGRQLGPHDVAAVVFAGDKLIAHFDLLIVVSDRYVVASSSVACCPLPARGFTGDAGDIAV